MDTETFYGVTLTSEKPLAKFEISDFEKSENIFYRKLIIRQILLGYGAEDGELNVVQAEPAISEKEGFKIPIAVLKAGETRFLTPNIEFPSTSVTFKLIQGKGPVHIHGQHVITDTDGVLPYEEEEDYEDISDVKQHAVTSNGKNQNSHKRK